MKVVLVGSFAPSLLNFRGPLLKDIVAAGHEVWGMAPGSDPETAAKLKEMGVTYVESSFKPTSMNPIDDLKGAKILAKQLEEIKPDIVLSYTIRMAIWVTAAASWAGVPHRAAMVTGLGTAFLTKGIKGRAMKLAAENLLRWSMKKATTVIVQNPDDGKALIDIGAASMDKVKVVNGSGVDLSRFAEKPLPPKPVKFLMIARLLVEKGVKEYAEAAKIVKAKHPEAEFDLVGPHEEHPASVSRADLDSWVASGAVKWHGQQDDVRPWLEACHIFVLPSYREGTPRTVLEALATGRPIITTDVPGCRSTIEHGVQGLLTADKDSSALAESMLKMLETPGLIEQMASVARQRALDKYEVSRVNQDMMKYMNLL